VRTYRSSPGLVRGLTALLDRRLDWSTPSRQALMDSSYAEVGEFQITR